MLQTIKTTKPFVLFKIGETLYFDFAQIDSALNRYNYILEKFSSRGYTQITEASEREGDVKHTLANIDKLRALGWEPNVGFEEGLESVFDYWGL